MWSSVTAKPEMEQNKFVSVQKRGSVNGATDICISLFCFNQEFHLAPFLGWSNVNAKPETELQISVFVQKQSIV